MKRRMLTVTLAAALVSMSAGFIFAPVFGPAASASATFTEDCDDQCQEDLSEARAATARYHQESRALEDGFFSEPICVQAPGAGAMGFHYPNPSRASDTSVDPAAPEVLLYEQQADGRRRLVALEYFAPVIVNGSPWFGPGPPPAGQYNTAPVLFGRAFDGPMPGHNPAMPWHYDLHVWAWRHNPAGLFAAFNPKVSCQ